MGSAFLNLPDLVLLKVAEQADFNTKKSLMATSSRLNSLIGKNSKLCENMTLTIRNSRSPEKLGELSRNITSVSFKDYKMTEEKFDECLQLIQKIGVNLKKIYFLNGSVEFFMLPKLLAEVPNIEEVVINQLKIRNFVEVPAIDHEFKRLKKLYLHAFHNHENIANIFMGAENLEDLSIFHCYKVLQDKLKLQRLKIGTDAFSDNEDFDLNLDHLKFQLSHVELMHAHFNPGTFKRFIKQQKSLQSFKFLQFMRQLNPELIEIITHVLNLESLRDVEMDCVDGFRYLSDDIVSNPKVQRLAINNQFFMQPDNVNQIQRLLTIFPGIKALKLKPKNLTEENCQAINRLQHLDELVFSHAQHEFPFESLHIRNLKKWQWSIGDALCQLDQPKVIAILRNHPTIIDLSLEFRSNINMDFFYQITENMRNLERFTFQYPWTKECLFEFIDFASINCQNLKHLELGFASTIYNECYEKAFTAFAKKNPNLRLKFHKL